MQATQPVRRSARLQSRSRSPRGLAARPAPPAHLSPNSTPLMQLVSQQWKAGSACVARDASCAQGAAADMSARQTRPSQTPLPCCTDGAGVADPTAQPAHAACAAVGQCASQATDLHRAADGAAATAHQAPAPCGTATVCGTGTGRASAVLVDASTTRSAAHQNVAGSRWCHMQHVRQTQTLQQREARPLKRKRVVNTAVDDTPAVREPAPSPSPPNADEPKAKRQHSCHCSGAACDSGASLELLPQRPPTINAAARSCAHGAAQADVGFGRTPHTVPACGRHSAYARHTRPGDSPRPLHAAPSASPIRSLQPSQRTLLERARVRVCNTV